MTHAALRTAGHPGSRNGAGFTLIELLIVVIILGVLTAIVVVAVSAITDRGKQSACAADRHMLETAEEAYFSNHHNYASLASLVPNFIHESSTLHDITRADGTPMADGSPDYQVVPATSDCSS